jgi:hypothetical protein
MLIEVFLRCVSWLLLILLGVWPEKFDAMHLLNELTSRRMIAKTCHRRSWLLNKLAWLYGLLRRDELAERIGPSKHSSKGLWHSCSTSTTCADDRRRNFWLLWNLNLLLGLQGSFYFSYLLLSCLAYTLGLHFRNCCRDYFICSLIYLTIYNWLTNISILFTTSLIQLWFVAWHCLGLSLYLWRNLLLLNRLRDTASLWFFLLFPPSILG